MGVTPLRTALRPSLVDGLFYPARKETLAADVDGLLGRPETPRAARWGIISPHAGYEYAGPVMGAAFRAIAERAVRTAVVIGPVHRDAEEAIYLPESSAFSTPLGAAPVDEEALAALAAADPMFQRNDIPHLEEHCLELQLPFLLRLFPGVSIVPLLVGAGGRSGAETLARCLSAVFGPREDSTVYVVTANMASYMTGTDTRRESQEMEALLARGDWKGVLRAAETRRISACGTSCVAGLLALAGSRCEVQILARARSEDPDEDPARTVHYAAVSIQQGPP